ncbi:MAG: hypothetical protein V2J10_03145 [Wenzhouxiangella sp.]|nr:hypothetical protein [Wenzhouxiangella sp.]
MIETAKGHSIELYAYLRHALFRRWILGPDRSSPPRSEFDAITIGAVFN